jgi:hypothetical protein
MFLPHGKRLPRRRATSIEATRDLRMGGTRLGAHAGVIGAAVMVIEHVLAPENVDRAVHQHTR